MPIKSILLHLEAEASAQAAIDYATSLAKMIDAHLSAAGLAINYPPRVDGAFVGGGAFGSVLELQKLTRQRLELLEQAGKLTKQRRESLGEAGKAFVANAAEGISADFILLEGFPGEACNAFARLARYFDLTLVASGAPFAAHLSKRVVIETLFGSGRPILIVPYMHKGAAKVDRAVICWDGGVQAARALAAAIPLLALSRDVEVVTFRANRGADREPDPQVAMYLKRHGIKATLTELPRAEEVGNGILSYAEDTAADYIVMGGYGHWRLTEFIVGGTTRTVLGSMTTPVFMAH